MSVSIASQCSGKIWIFLSEKLSLTLDIKTKKIPRFVFVCAGGTLFPVAVRLLNWVALKGCYVTPEHVTKLAPNLDSGLGLPVCVLNLYVRRLCELYEVDELLVRRTYFGLFDEPYFVC